MTLLPTSGGASGVAPNNAAGSTSQRPSDEEVLAFAKTLSSYLSLNGIPSGILSRQTDYTQAHPDFDPSILLTFRPPAGPLHTIDLQLLGWGSSGSGVEAETMALRTAFNLSPSSPVLSWDHFKNPPPPQDSPTANPASSKIGPRIDDLSAALGMDLYRINFLGQSFGDIPPGMRYTDPTTGALYEYFRPSPFSAVWRKLR